MKELIFDQGLSPNFAPNIELYSLLNLNELMNF